MNGSFYLLLLLSLLVGSIWVTLTTILAERFGSKIGGLIGGLPSTAIVAFFFIGLTQSPLTASQATNVFPLAYSITGLFLVFYAVFSKKGFIISLFGSLLIWFFLSALIIYLKINNFFVSLLAYSIIFFISFHILEKKLKIASAKRIEIQYSSVQLLGRAAFSGIMIAFAVFMSKAGGPIFGGVFSAFPAVFISILVISYKSRGMSFSRAMTKPLMMTGMLSIVVYATSIKYFYPRFGLIVGTVSAYLFALLSAYLSYVLFQKRAN
ncbi:MAG: DUF3147 family protein [Candidatus Aminicenantes bacterium]|nr:DUF3147 family protein [Candidatus Aminicenantes bacterium]MDH5742866.1 DUF3147 family protein [Candidatus Aminicenantes bacterium]